MSILGLGPPRLDLVQQQATRYNINTFSTPGTFRFHVNLGLLNTSLDRKLPVRWEPVNRVGREPAMQFLGPGEETVTIPGFLYPHDFGGAEILNRMRSEARQGIPRPFGNASGKYFGLWCLKEIEDRQSFFIKDGSPRKIEFNIHLSAYGPDGASGFSIYI